VAIAVGLDVLDFLVKMRIRADQCDLARAVAGLFAWETKDSWTKVLGAAPQPKVHQHYLHFFLFCRHRLFKFLMISLKTTLARWFVDA
jgi:hypothetical protein